VGDSGHALSIARSVSAPGAASLAIGGRGLSRFAEQTRVAPSSVLLKKS